jgi:AcrR family transcriptional regulator
MTRPRWPMRARILTAARALAARSGAEGFTVLEVSREAGVSHTTVYNHFESRCHMLEALAHDWNMAVFEAAAAYAAEIAPHDPTGRLQAFMLEMARLKRALLLSEARLFEAFHAVLDANPVLREPFLLRIKAHIAETLREGERLGVIKVEDVDAVSRALLILSAKFRHAVFIEREAFADLEEQLNFAFQHVFRPLLKA